MGVGGAVEVAAPGALGLRVLEGRRAACGGGDCGGGEWAAGDVGGGAGGGDWGAGVLRRRGLVGCKVHGCWCGDVRCCGVLKGEEREIRYVERSGEERMRKG